MKALVLLYLVLISNLLFGQTKWVQIDEKEYMDALISVENKIPVDQQYFLSSETSIFSNYESKIPLKKVPMKIWSGSNSHFNMKNDQIFIVSQDQYLVYIDSLEREIILQFAENNKFKRKQSDDYKELASIARRIFKEVSGNNVVYYLELNPGNQFNGVELVLKNDWIEKVVYYSSSPYDYNEFGADLARFEMKINEYQVGNKVPKKALIEISEILNIQGEVISLQEKFTDFKLIDLRN